MAQAGGVLWFGQQIKIELQKQKKAILTEVAKQLRADIKARCPVGTIKRPMYKTGKGANQGWTERKPGTLNKSIRYKVMMSRYGDMARGIAGGTGKQLTAYYARIVEHYKPFMRPALDEMLVKMPLIAAQKKLIR